MAKCRRLGSAGFSIIIVFSCLLLVGEVSALKTALLIGEGCNATSPCQENYGVICHENKCMCPEKFTPTIDRLKCLPLAQSLGDPCQQDNQCTRSLGPYSRCKYEVCACTENYVPLSTGVCAPIATDADRRCKEPSQCSKPFGDKAVCMDGVCSCMKGFHLGFHATNASKQCILNKELTEDCDLDNECYLDSGGQEQNVKCTDNSCACAEGYRPSDANHMCIANDNMSAASRVNPVLTCLVFVLFFTQAKICKITS